MIKILIVDDIKPKIQSISQTVCSALGKTKARIDTAENIASATKKIAATMYDLIVLDLNIPLIDKKAPQKDGGLRLLSNLKNQRNLNRPNKIIGLTAYTEMIAKYKKEFADQSYLLVGYSANSTDWQAPIASMVGQIISELDIKNSDKRSDKRSFSSFDKMMIVSIFFITVVSTFLPISFTPIQSTLLFLMSSILVAILFGKTVQSKFELKLPWAIGSTTGAASLVFILLILLSKLSTPDNSIGIYEIFDANGKSVMITNEDIEMPVGVNAQRLEYFTKNNSLLVVFSKGSDNTNIHIKGYSGTIRYSKNKVQCLRFGSELKGPLK